jgi:hypothetical protein
MLQNVRKFLPGRRPHVTRVINIVMNIMGPQQVMAAIGLSQSGTSLARHQPPEIPTYPAQRFETAKTQN